MVIICDTRQQAGKHKNIERYFERNGIETVRHKLDVGDYAVEGVPISVDTKQDLSEVYCNLITDHDRFRRECVRAKDSGIRLIVLVEDSSVSCLEDVKDWQNPRVVQWNWAVERGLRPMGKAPPISSKRLYGIMRTMTENYGIQWEFCHKNSTGKRIVELLTK